MIRTNAVNRLLTTVTLTVATAFAQSSDRLTVTDTEKIAHALLAGPAFITKNATVLDWPSVRTSDGHPKTWNDPARKSEPAVAEPVVTSAEPRGCRRIKSYLSTTA